MCGKMFRNSQMELSFISPLLEVQFMNFQNFHLQIHFTSVKQTTCVPVDFLETH